MFFVELSELVAKRLRKAIENAGLSQSDFAEKCGLTFATVNAFCNGRGKIVNDTLHRMAEMLGLPIEHFIRGGGYRTESGEEVDLNPLQREVLASVNETLARLTGTANVVPVPATATPEQRAILAEIVATIAKLRDEEITAMLPGVQALAQAFEEQRPERDARREPAEKKKQS